MTVVERAAPKSPTTSLNRSLSETRSDFGEVVSPALRSSSDRLPSDAARSSFCAAVVST